MRFVSIHCSSEPSDIMTWTSIYFQVFEFEDYSTQNDMCNIIDPHIATVATKIFESSAARV
jgi:hypothetical protein